MARGTTNSETSRESSSYLRRKKPVRVSRGLGDWRQLPWRRIGIVAAALSLCVTSAYSVDRYLHTNERFVFAADGSSLLVSGLSYVKREEVRAIFDPDFGKNLFDIPIDERQQWLASLPWVEQATVARVGTHQIWAHIQERRPVAFARVAVKGKHETTKLVDANGVFLDVPEKAQLALPVISGVTPGMDLDERQKRIRLYLQLLTALDSAEPRYSSMVSEVDVADAENAKATAVYHGEAVELQMGEEYFRHRFEVFLNHFAGWKQKYGVVRTVDLRFKGQVALEHGLAEQ
ncbi:MAG: FtsQ-type POTRA domain-containing protein [Bryobacterales bacterium]